MRADSVGFAFDDKTTVLQEAILPADGARSFCSGFATLHCNKMITGLTELVAEFGRIGKAYNSIIDYERSFPYFS
jgi:hypothetical protein